MLVFAAVIVWNPRDIRGRYVRFLAVSRGRLLGRAPGSYERWFFNTRWYWLTVAAVAWMLLVSGIAQH